MNSYQSAIFEVESLDGGDRLTEVRTGMLLVVPFVQCSIGAGFQFVIQHDAPEVSALGQELRFDCAAHPEQAGVVPDLRRFHPAGVIHLAGIVVRIAMMIEEGFALRGHGDDVGHRSISQTRDGPLLDQPLTLQGAQIVAEATGIAGIPLEIVGEDHAEARRTLQQIHFRAPEMVDAVGVSDRLALAPCGQCQAVPTTAVDRITGSRCDAVLVRA